MRGDASWWKSKNKAAAKQLRSLAEYLEMQSLPAHVVAIPGSAYTVYNNGVQVTILWGELKEDME